jgi:hypothetical protein
MKWVDCEQRCHSGTLPQCAGHLPEHPEEQQHRNGMQKDIRRMMAAGL